MGSVSSVVNPVDLEKKFKCFFQTLEEKASDYKENSIENILFLSRDPNNRY